ncbi:MAG: hypothetical protein NTV23_14350 [Propionibacteriales bacterium]|nr:hypothetical protein [Propionibacteriales bacterium]
MILLLLAMLLILVVAAAVVLYVAYPHRDQEVPGAPWLGDAMKRGVEAMPTLEEEPVRPESLPLTEFTRS